MASTLWALMSGHHPNGESRMTYAVCCKKCGHIENTAWIEHEGRRIPSAEPLTPRGHVPIYCQKCGERDWRVPATADDITDYEAKNVRLARATELCRSTNLEGLLKISEEVRASAEVKNAIGNLLAPLEGETLRAAQSSCIKVARSGLAIS